MARIIRVHPRKSTRAAIDRFLRSPPHNKPFSIISDPAFTEANKVLGRFRERPKENGKNSWRSSQKSNLERAGKETISERRTRPSQQFKSCPVTEDGLVLTRPLFWKTGTLKPATVDTRNASLRKCGHEIMSFRRPEVSSPSARFLNLNKNLAKPKVENLIKQLFHSRLLDMRLVIALRASLAIYHLISNARSWNNCLLFSRQEQINKCNQNIAVRHKAKAM